MTVKRAPAKTSKGHRMPRGPKVEYPKPGRVTAVSAMDAGDKIKVDAPRISGRPIGVPNKVTRSIKDSLIKVYNDIGGDERLGQWAMENPGEFYTKLWVKILPVKLVGDPDNPIQFEVIIRPHGTATEALPAIEHGVTVDGAEYEVEP